MSCCSNRLRQPNNPGEIEVNSVIRKILSNRLAIGFTFSFAGIGNLSAASADAKEGIDEQQWQMLENYCIRCHNFEDYFGGIAFDVMQPDQVHQDAAVWEKVIVKLRARMMPPRGEERPEPEATSQFITSLEGILDNVPAENLNPGFPAFHRLNRTEYANAVRDLLDLPFDAKAYLPADDSMEGFDNIASSLTISPALLQSYFSLAGKISRLAIGDITSSSSITTYRAAQNVSQAAQLEGFPEGTRGGISITHVFPLDAEYQLNIQRGGNGFLPAMGANETIELSIDGVRVQLMEPGAPHNLKLPIPAGPHTLTATYLHSNPVRGVDDFYSEFTASSSVASLTIDGPFNASGSGDTPSRRKIFLCRPEIASEEEACAQTILTNIATRAYRRPLDPDSLATIMEFFRAGNELRGFETGIQYGLTRILVDPLFLIRFEIVPEGVKEGEIYNISDFELASRLSFFIWSSIPDEQLLTLASRNQLSDPAILKQQVERMLVDPKSKALVENFASQWLSLPLLDSASPVTTEFDGNLRQAMRRETELLFSSIIDEDRSILDLLDADYTFVNDRLAEHYGIPNIRGSDFRKVNIADENRRGILGHASILTLTSTPTRTSPVIRGKWIMENILGAPPPPPPPGVETSLEEKNTAAEGPTTIRQRLERHQADPNCSNCHSMIDPLGFALENFDLIGKWRDTDTNGQPVDTETTLWYGAQMHGPQQLREALFGLQDNFTHLVTKKLMTYALGRQIEPEDMPMVRDVVRNAGEENFKFSSLVYAVVESPMFQSQKNPLGTSSIAENP